MSPDGDIRGQFKFPMSPEGYRKFAQKIPLKTRITFGASGSAYSFSVSKGHGICRHNGSSPKRNVMDN